MSYRPQWDSFECAIQCFVFLYNQLKKPEWKPDYGPATFVPRWGATITGARKLVIIYNVNLKATTEEAERIADGIKQHDSESNNVSLGNSIFYSQPNLTLHNTFVGSPWSQICRCHGLAY